MYKEKIDAYIDSKRDEILGDLMTLVRINSQRGEPKEGMPYGEGPALALRAAREMMDRYGLITKNYDNYVVTGDLSESPKELDILAHLDVVPASAEWTVTKPFEPRILDGRIYGRGTIDDKGPAVAALYAIRAVKELNIPLKKSVRLILGSDEECGSSDLVHYYAKEEEAPCTFTPDAEFPVINIEKGRMAPEFYGEFSQEEALPKVVWFKSGDKVNVVPQKAEALVCGLEMKTLEEKGRETTLSTGVSFLFEAQEQGILITARGRAAHASTPEEGQNALTALLRLISSLPLANTQGSQILWGLDKIFPYEDTRGKNLGIFRQEENSGSVTVCFSILEYVSGKVRGQFDSRLPIGCTEENTEKKAASQLENLGLKMEEHSLKAPHCVPGDSEFVKTLLSSYERYTGIKAEPISTGGGTYVHDLKRGVAFGCGMEGVDNHMHGDDEFIEIDTLLMSAKIFADAIVKLCG